MTRTAGAGRSCGAGAGAGKGPLTRGERRVSVTGLEAARAPDAVGGREGALGRALDDLATAVVRVGVEHASSAPSVAEGVAKLISLAGTPPPLGLQRFVGRLRTALAARDVRQTAALLAGATRVATALLERTDGVEAAQRVRAWLASGAASWEQAVLLEERVLVEVGRQWVAGLARAAIERRYLIDISTGVVYCEQRVRGEVGSIGPCPRQLDVALAEVEPGPSPPRIRLLQYTVSPRVDDGAWSQVAHVARQSFRELARECRETLVRFPALSEPFAVVAVAAIDRSGPPVPLDAEGLPLPIVRAGAEGIAEAFDRVVSDADPRWIAGRIVPLGDGLALAPFLAGSAEGQATTIHVLR